MPQNPRVRHMFSIVVSIKGTINWSKQVNHISGQAMHGTARQPWRERNCFVFVVSAEGLGTHGSRRHEVHSPGYNG